MQEQTILHAHMNLVVQDPINLVRLRSKKYNSLIGAMCEFLGLMRKNLMEQGFTREEAIAMCTMAMASMLSGGKKNDQET